MADLMLLLSGYRTLLVGLIAAVLWFTAYYIYFRRVLTGYFNRAKPHSWSIDMANKRAISRGRPENG